MSIIKKLNIIQVALKAPKGQHNNFGKYNYRSCEDIVEGVKPLLVGTGTILLLGDEIVEIGNRIYVKATAMLKDEEHEISVSAFARESLSQKGMNEAQITGSASSYARKYALNGLFAIDDTKDADTQDNSKAVDAWPDAIKNAQTMDDLMNLHAQLDSGGKARYKELFTNRKEQLENQGE